MIRHADILDTHESLRKSFVGAITLHGSVILALLLHAWLQRPTEQFGDKNPSGGAVSVGVVDKIPLPHEGPPNPVANDTQSQVPQTPEKDIKERQKIEKPPPDAIKLHSKKAKEKPAEKTAVRQIFRNYKELQENQLTSRTAPQVSNPMFSQQAGAGQVGTTNSTLGSQFAGYAAQIRDIVARNWRTGDVEARYQTAPPVIVTFDLMRDGSVRNVTIVQRSGIPSLDTSVQRAVLDSNPLPPIPQGFDKNSAKVEFTFELKR